MTRYWPMGRDAERAHASLKRCVALTSDSASPLMREPLLTCDPLLSLVGQRACFSPEQARGWLTTRRVAYLATADAAARYPKAAAASVTLHAAVAKWDAWAGLLLTNQPEAVVADAFRVAHFQCVESRLILHSTGVPLPFTRR